VKRDDALVDGSSQPNIAEPFPEPLLTAVRVLGTTLACVRKGISMDLQWNESNEAVPEDEAPLDELEAVDAGDDGLGDARYSDFCGCDT
jgi:hypothetical protein